MKIVLAQCNYHIGNFARNEDVMLRVIRKAKSDKADLVVFSELSVCGYPPADFLEFDEFIEACQASAVRVAQHCDTIAAIVGLPLKNPEPEGKRLFNAACLLVNKQIVSTVRKTLLPTYDIFDEYRYFEPNTIFNTLDFKGERIALTLCEDLWDVGDELMYTRWPMDELVRQKPTLMINIAASPYHHNQIATRTDILKRNVARYRIPLIYVNQCGAQTELLFDGGSLAMDSSGAIVRQLAHFNEDYTLIDTRELKTSTPAPVILPGKMEMCRNALVMGIRDYFSKSGFSRAILGLSGGLDSAVVMVLAAEALGAENVRALLLPSRYSSEHSITDARELAENVGVPCEIIPIEEDFQAFERTLDPFFSGLPSDITEENLQARIRATILMAFSNKFGNILLNTSNKSEAAVGYGTLYGDMCGGLSVIGDLYKTEVYELAREINRQKQIIPENILLKAPSAELRHNQKDEDSLPPYAVLDVILFRYIELCQGPEEIVQAGFNQELVLKVLRLVNTSEHKRRQSPPSLRVSSKAFGYGRRMPIAARYLC